jgi:hypothetical protein
VERILSGAGMRRDDNKRIGEIMKKMWSALLAACLLMAQAGAAEVGSLPVKRLPSGTAPTTSRTPAAEPAFWLSGMAGYQVVEEANLTVQGWGAYLRGEPGLVGLRARYASGLSGLRHGRELGVLLGRPLTAGGRVWAALGVSRYELERRQDNSGSAPVQEQAIGVPLELVWAPHGRHLGLELRAEANLNSVSNGLLIGLGLQLGKL